MNSLIACHWQFLYAKQAPFDVRRFIKYSLLIKSALQAKNDSNDESLIDSSSQHLQPGDVYITKWVSNRT